MNDDYLWDRTGEPDKEVQNLEEVLATLRYQQRPLQLPITRPIATRRSFAPGLAIAAAIALLLLGATLWLRFHRAAAAPAPAATNQLPRHDANQPLPKSAATLATPPKNATNADNNNQRKSARTENA